jgi:hypothetical protein
MRMCQARAKHTACCGCVFSAGVFVAWFAGVDAALAGRQHHGGRGSQTHLPQRTCWQQDASNRGSAQYDYTTGQPLVTTTGSVHGPAPSTAAQPIVATGSIHGPGHSLENVTAHPVAADTTIGASAGSVAQTEVSSESQQAP